MHIESDKITNQASAAITIIIPCWNEQNNLAALHKAILAAVLNDHQRHYDIIFVDDGSSDQSVATIRSIASSSPVPTCLLSLPEHQGKAAALAAGIAAASGDVVVTIDADLQNDPQDIPRLVAKIAEGHDVVCGWRVKRRGEQRRAILSRLFNWAISLVSITPLHDSNCGLKAIRIEKLHAVRLYGQLHRFIVLLMPRDTKITEVEIAHHVRLSGKSKYTLTRYFHAFRDFPLALLVYKNPARMSYAKPIVSAASSLLAATIICFANEWFCFMSLTFLSGSYVAFLFAQYVRYWRQPTLLERRISSEYCGK
jgi:glycosyltransferase involved in cell wall biosynthesis